ncbi:SMALL AUXIN UPREGULATED 72 [Hibiscus trionum]|uniref:SMALL AUXIN UPREGULATED 72 n=1 Tax=Hibiscus trionum TaxID=183268 RepID=A0A9W7I5Y8_HIBTR|nr:SMALL AUXIN UPREGULATED 72 [Hibiscus trionum]
MKQLIRHLSRVADVSAQYKPPQLNPSVSRLRSRRREWSPRATSRLLNKSAQEYEYEQKGVLHIPRHVLAFERVTEALRLGVESRDLQDLLRSISDDCF